MWLTLSTLKPHYSEAGSTAVHNIITWCHHVHARCIWPVWTVALCPPWFWNRLCEWERESFSWERKQKPSSRKKRCRKWLCVLLPLLISFTLPLLPPSYEQLKCFLFCCDPHSRALLLLTLLLKLRSTSKAVKMYPACQDPMWVPTELERMCRAVDRFWQLATATLLGQTTYHNLNAYVSWYRVQFCKEICIILQNVTQVGKQLYAKHVCQIYFASPIVLVAVLFVRASHSELSKINNFPARAPHATQMGSWRCRLVVAAAIQSIGVKV